jgi:hypothetical protein
MTPNERMTRYRWGLSLTSTLGKAARLIEDRPEGKPLPPLPEALVRAYELDKRPIDRKRQ